MDLIYLLGAVLLLLLGGDTLTKAFSGLVQRGGAAAYTAGLLLMAFATSLPELAVNAYAVAAGKPGLALGNAVGSNVVNIGLTLAVAGLMAPLWLRMRLLGTQIVFLLVASGLVLVLGLDGVLSRFDGALLMLGFLAMLAFVLSRRQQESDEVRAEVADVAFTQTGLAQNLLRFAVGAALLYFAARWVVVHAPPLGLQLGLTDVSTGLIIVAIVTALPEIAVAALLARQGKHDVLVGMLVLGASLFNLLFVLGGMALWQDVPVPRSFASYELPAAMAFALALYPLIGGDMRLSRRDAAFLLVLFLVWLAFALLRAGVIG